MARKVDEEGTERRKKQILKAAGDSFSKHGFHKSTMADICKRAKLSPGTVYHYFKSKEDLIIHFAERELEESVKFAVALDHTANIEELIAVTVDSILDSEGFDELQVYLEIFCEGGRNNKIGRILIKSDMVVYDSLRKNLKRLNAGGKSSIDMLARFVGIQIAALEILKLDEPSLKECREVSKLCKEALLHILKG